MNKVFAIGRLCADPTLNSQNGVSVLNFRLAADTRKTDREGNKITAFYRVALWRRQEEALAPYLHKGDRVSVAGDFVPTTYTDANGIPRMSMDIENADVEMLTTKAEREAMQQAADQRMVHADSAPTATATNDDDDEDNLPF